MISYSMMHAEVIKAMNGRQVFNERGNMYDDPPALVFWSSTAVFHIGVIILLTRFDALVTLLCNAQTNLSSICIAQKLALDVEDIIHSCIRPNVGHVEDRILRYWCSDSEWVNIEISEVLINTTSNCVTIGGVMSLPSGPDSVKLAVEKPEKGIYEAGISIQKCE